MNYPFLKPGTFIVYFALFSNSEREFDFSGEVGGGGGGNINSLSEYHISL